MFPNYLDGAIVLMIAYLAEDSENEFVKNIFARINQQTRRLRRVPCSTFRTVCSHKMVAVSFNTLYYDASVGVLNPPHE